jgi:dolichyl-phosphate-mannose--protein O-mannosyl transferase
MRVFDRVALVVVRRGWPFWVLLAAVSAALHFVWFDRPLSVVFDEVYFPKFGLAYLRNEYYFDLHPPLGKLIYGATAWVAGLDPSFSFATNHLPLPDPSYLALRVPPRVAGTLLPLLLAAVALELGLSRGAALAVGLLAALDNALLVMSRFALMDSFLLLFGFGALWCWLRGRGRGGAWWIGAAVLGGAALSIKWTGLSFIALILLFEGVAWLRRPHVRGIGRPLAMVLLAGAVYVAGFAAHFAIAYRTGPDDGAMSRGFQATLQGNPNAADPSLVRPGFVGKFVELHQRMFHNTRTTTGPHAYASRWYDWPFMMRSVDFWAEHKDGQVAHIYFLGNPAVWWAAGYCILFLLVNFPPRLVGALEQPRAQPIDRTEWFIVAGYLANLVPFVVIARIMFAYHYLPALCFALLGLGFLLDRCGGYRRPLALALLALAVAAFFHFAPLSYALPLTQQEFDARFWVRGWR